ncbi:MAG: GatB/YqeY domain-containing protein [Candidatus Staskawiczbacteria bacterium]|nr:GatB/YqeY domain-containing protein [Candidatus Staskawiczbacteria bacterium]
MALKQQLQANTIEAMKQKNQELVDVLRMTTSAIQLKEKEQSYKTKEAQKDLEDDQVISVLSSEIKKRKDAIALYEQGGRPELADKEKSEIAMLQAYLPEQLSQDELKKLITGSIAKTGATEVKDMGKIMADIMPQVKGKADNSEISKIIKELLSK